MKCPNCGSQGRFIVVTEMCVIVNEDGTEEVDDQSTTMKDDDLCTCDECEYAGDLKAFEVEANETKDGGKPKGRLPWAEGNTTESDLELAKDYVQDALAYALLDVVRKRLAHDPLKPLPKDIGAANFFHQTVTSMRFALEGMIERQVEIDAVRFSMGAKKS